MAKKSKSKKKLEEALNRSQKRAIKKDAELKAMQKMIDRGWRPKD